MGFEMDAETEDFIREMAAEEWDEEFEEGESIAVEDAKREAKDWDSEDIPSDFEFDGERPQRERPEGEKPEGEKPEGEKPEGEKPEGEKPEGEKSGKKAKAVQE